MSTVITPPLTKSPTIITEVFPVLVDTLPPLTAYRLEMRNGDLATIGGKFTYRIQKACPGRWIWSYPWIVTDTPPLEQALQELVETAWSDPTTSAFHGLLSIRALPTWQPSAQVQADFVARGLWPELKFRVEHTLQQWSRDLSSIRVYRTCEARGWVVQGEPALSISIDSRLIATQDLQTYLLKASASQNVIDLMVADKESTMKGTVIGIAGSVAEHRKRLLGLTSNAASKKHIQQARDDETVVQVYATNRNTYDYAARGLNIVVRTSDYARFGVNGARVTPLLRLSPQQRSEMIRELSKLARNKGWIGAAYSSAKYPHFFLNTSSMQFIPQLQVGNGQQMNDLRDRTIQQHLQRYGFYKRVTPADLTAPIAIGVLNALPKIDSKPFLTGLQGELRLLKFLSQIVHIETVTQTSRDAFDQAIHLLQDRGAQIITALLPNEGELRGDTIQWNPYDHFKSLTIGRDFPGQVIQQSTMANTYAFGNIALGMLSKLGNIPYVLATPLPYADIVVGIDVARRRKTKLVGSLNATAITRLYQNSGEFLQYGIHDTVIEGETIPSDVLHALFPAAIFRGKRVVIHRDGSFRGEEKLALQEWATQLDAQFYLVEILKTGTPRLYQFQSTVSQQFQTMQQPVKGSALKINNTEAFLISSLPPYASVTPYPLHIRCEAPFPIEQAIHSILSLTLLHYGSLRTPRLPVTIHYSDEIAYLALKGIKPKSLEGTLPFWL
jgi:Piwi domain